MAYQSLQSSLQSWPSAADGVTVTSDGGAWGSSAGVELTSATTAAAVLFGISVLPPSSTEHFEIDIGTGAGGAEVVVTRFRSQIRMGNGAGERCQILLPVALDNIANGVRVAARIRVNTGASVAWRIAAIYADKPLTGSVLTTAVAQQCEPSAALPTTVQGGTPAWANGTWVELTASTASAIVLTSIIPSPGSGEYELDIGTGAGGAEAVVTTIKFHMASDGSGGMSHQMPFYPLDNIGNGVRVAARMRTNGAAAEARIAYTYLAKPL
jgi:hypothetical protein